MYNTRVDRPVDWRDPFVLVCWWMAVVRLVFEQPSFANFHNYFKTTTRLLCHVCNFVRTFPIASNPLSNRSRTPRNRNAIPNPANPTPISAKKERNKFGTKFLTWHQLVQKCPLPFLQRVVLTSRIFASFSVLFGGSFKGNPFLQNFLIPKTARGPRSETKCAGNLNLSLCSSFAHLDCLDVEDLRNNRHRAWYSICHFHVTLLCEKTSLFPIGFRSEGKWGRMLFATSRQGVALWWFDTAGRRAYVCSMVSRGGLGIPPWMPLHTQCALHLVSYSILQVLKCNSCWDRAISSYEKLGLDDKSVVDKLDLQVDDRSILWKKLFLFSCWKLIRNTDWLVSECVNHKPSSSQIPAGTLNFKKFVYSITSCIIFWGIYSLCKSVTGSILEFLSLHVGTYS